MTVVILLAGVLLAYGLLVVALFLIRPSELENWFRPKIYQHFSVTEWNSTKFGDMTRYKMASGLVRTKQLVGKSELEVRTLLGMPQSEQAQGGDVSIAGSVPSIDTGLCRSPVMLRKLGWTGAELGQRAEGDVQKVRIAPRLRAGTSVTLKWIAAELHMGTWTQVANRLQNLLAPNSG